MFDDISGTGCPIDFVSVSMIGFSGMADRMGLLPVAQNPRWRPAAILKISNDDLWNWINFDPINFLFHSRCLSAAREPHRLSAGIDSRTAYVSRYLLFVFHVYCSRILCDIAVLVLEETTSCTESISLMYSDVFMEQLSSAVHDGKLHTNMQPTSSVVNVICGQPVSGR